MSTMPYNLSTNVSSSLKTAFLTSKSLTTQFDKNSVALTSGKKINTALDNTTLYLKDMRLSESAEGLLNIIDGLSNIISTVDTSAKSLDTMTEFLRQAEAAANSAIDEPPLVANMVGTKLTPKDDMLLSELPFIEEGDEIILRTGDADIMESEYYIEKEATLADMGIEEGEELRIKVGEEEWVTLKVIDDEMMVSDFFNQVSEINENDNFLAEIEENTLTLTTNDKSPILLEGEVAEALGFNLENTHIVTIEEDWTVYDLRKSISEIENIQANINSEGYLEIVSLYGQDLMVYDLSGKTADTFGLQGYDDDGKGTTQTYTDMYNEVLKQIDNLVEDASFNGLNLLKGDTISAIFDEKPTNKRTIEGVKVDSASLGLSEAVNWEDPEEVKKAIASIKTAMSIVEEASYGLERASYAVQSRETYLESLSNTFQAGADSLTEADLNKVSAELLAIETQKQLVNEVLSITLESNSSVLRLF